MATFSASEVQAITDYLGAQYKRLLAIPASSAGADVLTAANDIVDYLEALADLGKALVIGADAKALQAALAAPYIPASTWRALLGNLRADVGSWDTFATDNTFLYYDYFRRLAVANGHSIAVANIFPDTTTLATFTVTGAATGTFSGTGGPVDSAYAGPQKSELEVTTDIGAGALTVTATMLKADSTTVAKTIAVTSGATAGTKFTVPSSGVSAADVFTDCNAIAVTGGTSGAFKIQTKMPRTPAV